MRSVITALYFPKEPFDGWGIQPKFPDEE